MREVRLDKSSLLDENMFFFARAADSASALWLKNLMTNSCASSRAFSPSPLVSTPFFQSFNTFVNNPRAHYNEDPPARGGAKLCR